jgi:Cu(I)-responsive transcriptional regulator
METRRMTTPLRIGQLSRRTGVPTKTIRYYESVGLLPQPARAPNGYRVYAEDAVRALRFVRSARELGFPLDAVRSLLGLWQDRARPSRDVQALARERMADVDARIAELTRLRTELQLLVTACHGDDRPDCPILDALDPASRAAPTTGGTSADRHWAG